MKRISLLVVLAVLGVYFTSCTNEDWNNSEQFSEELSIYLPAEASAFSGNNHYYHEVQTLSGTFKDNLYIMTQTGEIKNNDIGHSDKDYAFILTTTIDSEKMVEVSNNDLLNTSDYDRIVLLKTPLKVGNQWEFNTTNREGKRVKVFGEIIDITEQVIKVIYYDKSGYQESRHIEKRKGTIQLIKVYQYQDVKAITGFHRINDIDEKSEIPAFDSFESNAKFKDILINFNEKWENFINYNDPKIYELVEKSSPAFQILETYHTPQLTRIEFADLEVTSNEVRDTLIFVTVIEHYKNETGDVESTVTYELSTSPNGELLIYNFYAEP